MSESSLRRLSLASARLETQSKLTSARHPLLKKALLGAGVASVALGVSRYLGIGKVQQEVSFRKSQLEKEQVVLEEGVLKDLPWKD